MNDEAPKKKRTWIWVVAGVFIVLAFLAIGGMFAAAVFFRERFHVTEDITESAARSQFDAVYAKFPGQQPLIQLVDGRPQLIADRATRDGSTHSMTTLHVLAFDNDDEDLAQFSLPWWLLRMKSGPIRLSAYQQGWDDRGVSFRVEDIEKHGPGIIVDVKRNEGRMLIWAE
jgi:hypothetical protein